MKAKERLQQAQDEVLRASRDCAISEPWARERLRKALDDLYDIEMALDDEREDRQR